MSTSTSSASGLLSLLRKSFPSAIRTSTSEADIPQLSLVLYPKLSYTDTEKVEITQWITTSNRLGRPDEDEAKHAERLSSLNTHLSTRTTLLGSKPCVADISLYSSLVSAVNSWTPEERTGEYGYRHIVRFIDFVQNAPVFGLALDEADRANVDANDVRVVHKPLDPKEEKERKRKEKAAATANGEEPKPLVVRQGKNLDIGKRQKDKSVDTIEETKEKVKSGASVEDAQPKKEKKEKPPKIQKAPAKETPLSPCLIDLRVGHILKAENHPNADSLYVSTIACGDPAGADNTSEYEGQVVRTVCSGLNGLIPLGEMQGRNIVAVCNLKPVTMRGIKSAAMVLAASPRIAEGEDSHKGPVELVNIPPGSKAGDRVYFEGWEGEPEGILNPKKKIWETIQPGFTTTDDLEVVFDASAIPQLRGDGAKGIGKLKTAVGLCSVQSLKDAIVR